MSEEWFCIRLLKATRYTYPGDIWRKLIGRGVEDAGTVTPSTSDDGKPDVESRLNVSNSLISPFFSISLLLPCLGKTPPSFHTPGDFWRFISNLSVFKPCMSDFVRLVGWQLQWLYLSSDDLIILFASLTLASVQGFSKILATHQKHFVSDNFSDRHMRMRAIVFRCWEQIQSRKRFHYWNWNFRHLLFFVPLYTPHTLESWYFCPRFTRSGWSFWFHKRLPCLKIKLFLLAHYLVFWFELSSLDRFSSNKRTFIKRSPSHKLLPSPGNHFRQILVKLTCIDRLYYVVKVTFPERFHAKSPHSLLTVFTSIMTQIQQQQQTLFSQGNRALLNSKKVKKRK